jgi:hypothetical protein
MIFRHILRKKSLKMFQIIFKRFKKRKFGGFGCKLNTRLARFHVNAKKSEALFSLLKKTLKKRKNLKKLKI